MGLSNWLRLWLAMGCVISASALAQTTPAPTPPASSAPPPAQSAEPPALEPAAVDMLKAMSARLAAAKSMRFTTIDTFESPARNGQPLYYSTISNVTMQRNPDRLRIITPGDGPPTEFYYDGKRMVAYDPAVNLVAIDDAPPTLDAMAKAAFDKAAIYWPFIDLLVADPYKDMAEGLKSAFVVGESQVVGGVPTTMVAIANDNVQMQIWIGAKDGLPRMVRGSFPKDPNKRRFETQLSNWSLGRPVEAGAFTSAKAQQAPRIPFAHPAAEPAKPKP